MPPMPAFVRRQPIPLAFLIACLFANPALAKTDNGGSLSYRDDESQVGVGVDDNGKFTGELKYLLTGTLTSGTVGELWAGDGAGGLKLSYNWIPADSDGKPDRNASIRKVFGALDQNSLQDRKMTLGGGLENGSGFVAAYFSHSASGNRDLAARQETLTSTVNGVEGDRPYIDTITQLTTINAYEHPFDWGVGVRAGRYLDEHGLRLSIGADHEWGEQDAQQTTLSLDVEKYFGASPWSVAVRAEAAVSDKGDIGRDNDTRGWIVLRYSFAKPVRAPTTYTVRDLADTAKAMPTGRTGAGAGTSTAQVLPASPGAEGTQVNIPAPAPAPQTYSYRSEKRMIKTTASMTADTLFNFDKASLTASANLALGKIAGVLNNQGYADKISLTGHTCDIGTEAYNLKLSQRRADSVKKYLVEQGKIKADDINAVGKGESEPLYPNTKGQRYKNRRVDMEFLTYIDKEETVTVPVANEPTVASVVAVPAAATLDLDKTGRGAATPAAVEPAIVFHSEIVEEEPAWIQHGLFASVPHKRTVDYYRVTTRSVSTSTARAYLNRGPAAVNDSAEAYNGVPVAIPVLANDSDPDSDTLSLLAISQPALGTAVISGNTIVYTPNSATQGGADSLTYTVSDGKGGTATATVSINLIANLAPVAVNDNATTHNGLPETIPVLANDSDPDGDSLTILSISQQPALGTAAISGNNIVYTPNSATQVGTDSLTYTISDGKGGTATATVTINLIANLAPTAVNNHYVIPGISSTLFDVLANDSDPENDPLSIIAWSQPALGLVTLENNQLRFISTMNFTTLNFSYTISDPYGGTSTAYVNLIDP